MTSHTKAVRLYTLSTCPWSKKARAFLDARGVAYSCVDHDLADDVQQRAIQEEMVSRGAAAFPYVRIGDDFIVGYNPDAYIRLLGLEDAR